MTQSPQKSLKTVLAIALTTILCLIAAAHAQAEVTGGKFLPTGMPSLPGDKSTVKNGKTHVETGCGVPVSLLMGKQGLTGSIGQEPVNFMKRGSQYYGIFRDSAVQLHLSGSQDAGYTLRGTIAGQNVLLQISGTSVTGSLACQNPQ